MNKSINILGNVLLLLLSTVLTLSCTVAAAEVYAWIKWNKGSTWHDPNTQFDAELGWSPVPSNYIDNWGGVRSNSLGYRSEEPDSGKPSIIVLGDSVAWGYGVSNEETMPQYLEDELSLRYDVQNLGVSGYGLGQQYLFLKRNIKHFPKLAWVVQVIYTGNDLADTSSNTSYGKRKPIFIPSGTGLELQGSPISKFCLRNLASKSVFVRRVEQFSDHFKNAISSFAGDITLSERELSYTVSELLKRTAELTKSAGAKHLFVLSPKKGDFELLSSEHQLFERVLGEQQVVALRLLDKLQATKKDLAELYYDPAHYTSSGNKRVAEVLAQEILRREGDGAE